MAVFKFMGATYRIIMGSKDLGENWGLAKYGTRELLIADGLLPRQRATTLIHEMTHAVFDKLGWCKRQDEMQVQRIEGILEAIVKENPELLREIISDICGPQKKTNKNKRVRKC